MRTRTRNFPFPYPCKWSSWLKRTRLSDGEVVSDGPNSGSIASSALKRKEETIQDEMNVRSDGEARAKEKRRNAQLRRNLRSILELDDSTEWLGNQPGAKSHDSDFQVHRCTHVKKFLDCENDLLLQTAYTGFGHLNQYSHTFQNGSFLTLRVPGVPDPLNSSIWNTKHYTADGYYGPDWFALLDKFNEASNSIIPSSSLLGESLVEHDIFVDAFKTLLNPSSLVKTFIKRFGDLGRKRLSQITLGQARKLAKDGSSAYLGYQFAVKPAIAEVKKVLTAHEVVRRRLNYLRDNGGNYVPVRVRGLLPSQFENQSPPTPGNFNHKILCDMKVRVATISGWAKVREDLNLGDTWQAYVQYFGLQKIAGLAWELVPMSFVVDWFTNAQDYINRWMSPPTANPFYNLRGFCHSQKDALVDSLWLGGQYRFSETNAVVVDPPGAWKVCSRASTSYTRIPSLPKSSGSVDFSNLGLFHLVTLGVMLLQKKL